MTVPPIPPDEEARLATLHGLRLLDSEAEEAFDRVTRLAQRLFDVPIALVSLVDANRQWFKSKVGLEASETPRDISFCGHAILQDQVMVVQDAHCDKRFEDNPLVTGDPNIRFYAGCPLRAANGQQIGTLCLIDRSPRDLSSQDSGLLKDLAQMVENNLAAVDLATSDELTGLSNRRGFDLLADKALKTCVRLKRTAAVLAIDLDEFKPINDQWGHAEGDNALRDFSECLLETFRDSDVIGRTGGDEFCIFLGGAEEDFVPRCIDRLDERLRRQGEQLARPYRLKYSFGMFSCVPGEDTTLSWLAEKADVAMYRHKNQRRAPFHKTDADESTRPLVDGCAQVSRIASAIWGRSS